MSSHIRYLAIVTEHPETLGSFYATYFGLRELGRGENGEIALTDGWYNVSLIKPSDANPQLGISHFGVAIEDVRDIEGRLEEFGYSSDIAEEPGGLFHGDYRVTAPNNMTISLSTHGFHTPATPRSYPSIRHMAMCIPRPNQESLLGYFENVFGFREPNTSKSRPVEERKGCWACDGETAIAILPGRKGREHEIDLSTEVARDNLNHFGWLVTDVQKFLAGLPEGSFSKRPDNRPMAEYRGFDPDRNPFDISCDKGYEVDVDTWVRG